MEGKKKMTKAEAFEWLKGTKVVLRTEDDQLNLQKKLFDVGYKWLSSGTTPLKLYDVSCVFFLGIDGFIQHEEYEDEANKLFCDTHVYKPIKLRDILSIEIVEEEEDTSMPQVEFERYVKILQAWSKRINSSFVFSERGMGIVRGDLLTKLEGEEKGAYYKIEATL